MPVYITATALGKLGHPEGEVCLTRAAAKHDIIQMVSAVTRTRNPTHCSWPLPYIRPRRFRPSGCDCGCDCGHLRRGHNSFRGRYVPADTPRQIPTLASCSFDEMVDAASPGQVQFLQLYVNADRARTIKIIKHAKERGVKALFVTVDAPQLGRREKVRGEARAC